MTSPSTVIVIPTYNERENISKLILAIFSLSIPDLNVIVVDDNSPDGTGQAVAELTRHFPVLLIARPEKLGLGSAYVAGFKKALALGACYIVEMDADFSHDPQDVPRLLAALAHADLAIGSRKIPGGSIIGWGWGRILMSAGAMWFSRLFLRFKVRDVTAGFRAFRRTVLEHVGLDTIASNGYAFQEEVLYRTQQRGHIIIEIPVTFLDRQHGKTKLSKKDIIEFFLTIVRLRLRAVRNLSRDRL